MSIYQLCITCHIFSPTQLHIAIFATYNKALYGDDLGYALYGFIPFSL